jgi:hypothetical protein
MSINLHKHSFRYDRILYVTRLLQIPASACLELPPNNRLGGVKSDITFAPQSSTNRKSVIRCISSKDTVMRGAPYCSNFQLHLIQTTKDELPQLLNPCDRALIKRTGVYNFIIKRATTDGTNSSSKP